MPDPRYVRAATVPLEIAHHGLDGTLHGHSLLIRAETHADVDLDQWAGMLREQIAFMEHGALEDTVGRTFEDIARAVLDRLPDAHCVTVILPTRGHSIALSR